MSNLIIALKDKRWSKIMGFTFLIVIALLMITPAAGAFNYKEYCGNNTFLDYKGGNDGGTYPHLHCEKRSLTYSPSSNSKKHKNIIKGDNFNENAADSACIDAANKNATNLETAIRQACNAFEKGCQSCN
jgi:hypothetical protein